MKRHAKQRSDEHITDEQGQQLLRASLPAHWALHEFDICDQHPHLPRAAAAWRAPLPALARCSRRDRRKPLVTVEVVLHLAEHHFEHHSGVTRGSSE